MSDDRKPTAIVTALLPAFAATAIAATVGGVLMLVLFGTDRPIEAGGLLLLFGSYATQKIFGVGQKASLLGLKEKAVMLATHQTGKKEKPS